MLLLLALETFHVIFLLVHDWLPLPPFSDMAAQRAVHSFPKRLGAGLATGIPFAALLYVTFRARNTHPFPGAVLGWLWFGYLFLFVGELHAWWVPYLRGSNPAQVQEYRTLFGNTHAFLPERNGIRPNTLHVVLHAATLLTLLSLAWLTHVR